MQEFTWTCNPELCLTAVDPKEGQAAPCHKWVTTAIVSRSHRPPWERTDTSVWSPTPTPSNPRTHWATVLFCHWGLPSVPGRSHSESQRGGSDQTGVKGPTGNPQEGPGLPLYMLKVVNFKTSPYHCLLTLFLAHCCRAPDTPLQ